MEFVMHPCPFGITMQQGAQLIALINSVVSGLMLGIFVLFVIYFEAGAEEGMGGVFIAVWVIVFLILLGNFALQYFCLLKGATEKNLKKLKIYLITSIVMMVLGFILTVVRAPSFATVIMSLLGNLIPIYENWVVFRLYKQIQVEGPYAGDGTDGYAGP